MAILVYSRCEYCKKDFKFLSRNGIGKYCSNFCCNKSKIGKPAPNKGMVGVWKLSQETKDKMRSSRLRKKMLLGYINSPETREKMRDAKLKNPVRYFLGKKRPEISAEKNYNWNGGSTSINQIIRTSLKYKQWREAVYKRDGYACVQGGKEHGNKINADHIKSFAYFPELRFDVSNGRTLCISCHMKTPNYAGRGRKYKEKLPPRGEE